MTDKIRVKAHERQGVPVKAHDRTKKDDNKAAAIPPIGQQPTKGVERLSRDTNHQIHKMSERGQRGVQILGRKGPDGGVKRVSRRG